MRISDVSSDVCSADLPHGLADGDLRELLLRQRKVDVNRVELLQGHQLGAGRNVFAGIDGADAEMPRERRTDDLLCNQGLLFGYLRLGRLQVRGARIKCGLTEDRQSTRLNYRH